MLIHYFKVWLKLTASSFQISFVSRLGAILFILAKAMRFIFFMLILILVVTRTQTLAGYTLAQSIIFFLTFNVIDTVAQLLFRDVYRFRAKIVSGDFDLILVKPMSALFRVLLGGADALDLVMLVPYVLLLVFFVAQIEIQPLALLYGLLLMFNAFFLAAAFHVFVLALGVVTTEIDHAIFIYRDLSSMVRFPVDIYREPLRGFITFIIPVGMMMTFPPKALFGLLDLRLVLISFGIGLGLFIVSLRSWKYALSQYTSASS